jgi:hypothetical protein
MLNHVKKKEHSQIDEKDAILKIMSEANLSKLRMVELAKIKLMKK